MNPLVMPGALYAFWSRKFIDGSTLRHELKPLSMGS
jgi:hypothetical protein